MEDTMKQFNLGFILGSLLTGSLGIAGTFYDKSGKPNAPTGSVQQFDYFRMRQSFIDAGNIRNNTGKTTPCAK
jgi:hypothetical protein